jgi:hypothetical protein
MNYSEIVALSLSYSDREDAEVSDRINDFIEITEARINRLLEVRKMATRSTITTVADQIYYGLPSNFSGLRDIEIYGTTTAPTSSDFRQTLQYVTPEQMNQRTATPAASTSAYSQIYYTIVADQIQIHPAQDGRTMEIVYYQNVPNLNVVDTTNWLTDSAPDAYVFGILTEINAFVKDAATSDLWNTRFLGVMNQLSQDDAKDRWSGQPLQMRAT